MLYKDKQGDVAPPSDETPARPEEPAIATGTTEPEHAATHHRAHRRCHALRVDAQPPIAPSLCPRPPTDRSPRASQVSSKSGVPCFENKPLLCGTSKKNAISGRRCPPRCARLRKFVTRPRPPPRTCASRRVRCCASPSAACHASMCEGAHGTTHGAQSRDRAIVLAALAALAVAEVASRRLCARSPRPARSAAPFHPQGCAPAVCTPSQATTPCPRTTSAHGESRPHRLRTSSSARPMATRSAQAAFSATPSSACSCAPPPRASAAAAIRV